MYEYYQQLQAELEQHTIREEQELFPAIQKYEENPQDENHLLKVKRMIKQELEELEAEHEAAGNLLRKIREVTQDYQLPAGACMSYQITFQRLIDLESDLFEHIHLENNILFPRVGQELNV